MAATLGNALIGDCGGAGIVAGTSSICERDRSRSSGLVVVDGGTAGGEIEGHDGGGSGIVVGNFGIGCGNFIGDGVS